MKPKKETISQLQNGTGDRRCRGEWSINNVSGHGQWWSISKLEPLKNEARAMNEEYGPGTHWVAFDD